MRAFGILVILGTVLPFFASCRRSEIGEGHPKADKASGEFPVAAQSSGGGHLATDGITLQSGVFHRLSNESIGIDFSNPIRNDHPRSHLYTTAFSGGGVCIGDYDDDGLPDVFLSSQTGRNRLYRQSSPWNFTALPMRF